MSKYGRHLAVDLLDCALQGVTINRNNGLGEGKTQGGTQSHVSVSV